MNLPTPADLPAVDVTDRQNDHRVDLNRWQQLAARALLDEGVRPPAEMGLSFIDAEEMTALNETHMDASGPTDVLAFPVDGKTPGSGGAPALVGDIMICPTRAAAAITSTHLLEDEIALLVVHGVLHLCGHDHAEPGEREVMQRRERELLAAFHSRGETAP